MPASRTLALSSLLFGLLAVPVGAQQLQPGTRVRGQAAAGPFAGRLAWAGRDSLAIVQRHDTLLVPRAAIHRLDIATGTRRNTLQGLGIGAGVGAASAAAVLLAYDDDGNDSELEGLKYLGAGTLLIGSAALGAITGALIKSSQWTRVRPSGLGVNISF
jgi:hypothetical protein